MPRRCLAWMLKARPRRLFASQCFFHMYLRNCASSEQTSRQARRRPLRLYCEGCTKKGVGGTQPHSTRQTQIQEEPAAPIASGTEHASSHGSSRRYGICGRTTVAGSMVMRSSA